MLQCLVHAPLGKVPPQLVCEISSTERFEKGCQGLFPEAGAGWPAFYAPSIVVHANGDDGGDGREGIGNTRCQCASTSIYTRTIEDRNGSSKYGPASLPPDAKDLHLYHRNGG